MKKTLIIIFSIIAVIAIALIFIFTRHKHVFSEATCTTAPTCECGEIQGEPLGHTWIDATYESPKTCELCGLTDGEPLTNADRGNATGEAAVKPNVETNTSDIDTSSIDWNSINPKVHAPFNKDLGIPAVDNIMCEYMLNNCPAFTQSTTEDTKAKLAEYLMDYYDNNFGDNEWLQFASTGDESVLNLEDSEEHEMTAEEIAAAEAQMKEKMYKKLAIKLGITVEEAKAMLDKNLNDNSDNTSNAGGGNANSGGNTNGGGGSAPVATPSTKQPNATEDTFVTPELPSGNNGTSNSDPWQGDGTFELGDLGDGGEIITDIQLNP